MEEKIAVILPVYYKDRVVFFKTAVESILNQTYKNFDLLIVADGKLSEELYNYLQTIKSSIKLLEFNENRGLPFVLNDAIDFCLNNDYQFIARMDADDVSCLERLEKQLKYLKENLKVEILGTNTEIIDETGNRTGRKIMKEKPDFNDFIKKCELVHPTVMFRAGFFRKYGKYDTSFKKSQDYELWLRASKAGAVIHNLPKILLKFRYEKALIKRRKDEQKYNIKIKLLYISGIKFYISILPNLFIKYSPEFLLKLLLNLKNAA